MRFGQKKKCVVLCMVMILALCNVLAGCGQAAKQETATVRVGSLKGPTSIGLLKMMKDAEDAAAQSDKKETAVEYTFHMATQADEVLGLMAKGELDIALIPANVASILYQKTGSGVAVIDINTLGVLYLVTGDSTVDEIADLKGRTIYLTGKGTTPDYVLRYLLAQNGLTEADCKLEYKSEATEVAAVLAAEPEAMGVLPQPFATAACIQNESLAAVLDLNEEWTKVQGEGGSRMVTGVTVVRKEFLEAHEAAVTAFLQAHQESVAFVNEDVEAAAALVVEKEIIAKQPIAMKAIPKCNVTYIDGTEMKQALSGYLEVLYQQDAASVGGALPGEDFYYLGK